MPTSAPFSLNRSGMLIAFISAAFAGQAGAAAGRVDFVSGNVTVSGNDGGERPLVRGSELDNGHTVRTAEGGRAQIRFTDGAYVSLQPNTEFAIKDYRFEGKTDGSERGFFALAKGAMRTVTGLVGRVNRNRYQITTPTATVGIRGTGGVIQVLNDGSTLVIGTSGIWSLTNPAGSIDVPAGVSGLAPSAPDAPPQQSTQQPTTSPDPIPQNPTQFSVSEHRDPAGNPILAAPIVLKTGGGYAASVAFGWPAIASNSDANAVFDSLGRLTSVEYGNGEVFKLDPTTGAHADFGTDGMLAWGRWTGVVAGIYNCEGPCSFTDTYNANKGLHYVIGMPTPTLPTSGTASYSLSGWTRPTQLDGLAAPGRVTSGSLHVEWSSGSYALSLVNLGVSVGSSSYRVDASTGFFNSSLFNLNATAVGTGGSACGVCGCSASVNGFFAGANADRAGISYHINDSFSKDIVGAAAFTKTGTEGPAMPNLMTEMRAQ